MSSFVCTIITFAPLIFISCKLNFRVYAKKKGTDFELGIKFGVR